MVTSDDLEKIARVEHPEPHRVLGPHPGAGGLFVRVFRPDAAEVRILPDGAAAPRIASRVHPDGIFEAVFSDATAPFSYRVEARHLGGTVTFRDGVWTGETPGGLIRGPQRVELAEAAE